MPPFPLQDGGVRAEDPLVGNGRCTKGKSRMDRLMALDSVAMSTVGLLFSFLAILAHPDGARDMRADARAMLTDGMARLRG